MQWWCSAVGLPWSWTWRPYPGVWLFVALIVAAFIVLFRRVRSAGRPIRRQVPFAAAGALLVWAALDWPIGALGGYLASLHMAQFLILAVAAPPLLLLGIPFEPPHPRANARTLGRIRGRLTHPLLALAIFAVVVIATHLPNLTDALMPTQAGSFAIDVAWLASGLLFWLPVISPRAPAWFGPPVKMGYLFANMILMTAPGAMITFSDLPIYAIFELAPPIPGINPAADQRLAGLTMRVGVALVTWIAISVMFLRWNRDEVRRMEEEAQTTAAG